MIKEIHEEETKKEIVTTILNDLPEWFGLEESTAAYIKDAQAFKLYASYENDEVTGFISIKETSEDTDEIYCMGIKKKYHRQGIGEKLYKYAESKSTKDFIQVKTVDEGHYKEYDQTVRFYKALGFKKLEVFPKMWDEWNPCLIMIKSRR